MHGRVDLQLCVSIMKLRLKSARSGEATFFLACFILIVECNDLDTTKVEARK